MTERDTLERIADRVRGIANSIANDSEPIDRTLLVAKLYTVISKIEALIPSKAEREYLKAAEVVFKKETAYQDGEPRDDGVSFFRVAIANAVDAYRALLQERGKK